MQQPPTAPGSNKPSTSNAQQPSSASTKSNNNKRKRSKGNGGAAGNVDVWDDSSLIAAWDEAQREYEMFHGENAGAGTQETGEDDEEEQEDEEMEQEPTEQVGKERGKGPALIGPVDDRPDSLKNRDQGSQRTAGQGQDDITIPMPAVDDPALANLIMSYYWSGYYAGYYAGQKRSS